MRSEPAAPVPDPFPENITYLTENRTANIIENLTGMVFCDREP